MGRSALRRCPRRGAAPISARLAGWLVKPTRSSSAPRAAASFRKPACRHQAAPLHSQPCPCAEPSSAPVTMLALRQAAPRAPVGSRRTLAFAPAASTTPLRQGRRSVLASRVAWWQRQLLLQLWLWLRLRPWLRGHWFVVEEAPCPVADCLAGGDVSPQFRQYLHNIGAGRPARRI